MKRSLLALALVVSAWALGCQTPAGEEAEAARELPEIRYYLIADT